MKIAIRGGHSLDIRGASGVVDEVTEDRKIYAKVRDYLRQLGHLVLDVTPTYSGSSGKDLSNAVTKANNWGADYFVSIHLNAGGGHGTEVLYKSTKGAEFANRIVSKITALGFTNRGSKADVRGLYEFNHTNMVNNIIEVFFCDSQDDVNLYNKIGVDVIAKAIVEGITEQDVIPSNPVIPTPQPSNGGNTNVKALQILCNVLGVEDMNGNALVVDGITGEKTRFAVSHLPLCGISYTQVIATKYLQKRMNELGFKGANGKALVIDGAFGANTAYAIKNYQKSKGLSADSVVGKNTWFSFL